MSAHEIEARELEHERLVEARLEVPLERCEHLLVDEPARVDASRDSLLELVRGLASQDMLEERGRTGALARGPRELLVELGKRTGQSEELEVSSEPLDDEVASACGSFVALTRSVSLGHAVVS